MRNTTWSLSRLAMLLSLMVATSLAASNIQVAHGATTCTSTSVSAAAGGNIDISIDTDLGCASKAQGVNPDGNASNPTTGYVQVTFPGGVSNGYAVFATEDNIKGGSHPYNTGSYSLQFTNCTGGTAVPDPINNYPVTNPNSNQFPTPPADGSGTTYSVVNAPFHFAATTAGGTVTCAYSLTVPGDPAAIRNIAAYTVDGFVFFTNQTQARSQSVKPAGACTTDCTGFPPPATATPELGSGELLATGILPCGLALIIRRRRARRRVQKVQ